ncbi:MAG: ABC transporter ATP-binding protein [Clostridiales bacterium]|nr:ABC transporter ATP-binding protein [Clostridiales bacterium]
MSESKIELKGLSQSYYVRSKETHKAEEFVALKDFSLSVGDGEFLSIVGPSGCGKSTLLDIVSGLTKPKDGEIIIDGHKVTGPALDRGFIMQGYALFPWRTVRRNVEYGLEVKRVPKKRRREISDQFIELVGLKDFEDRYPNELSGGMRQRVAIARSLAYDPQVLLMDEPFAAVDAQTRETLQDELLRIWQATKKTVVFVTHSIEEAVLLADRVVIMSASPGGIKQILPIQLPRPRTASDMRLSADFSWISNRIWKLLQNSSETLEESAEAASPASIKDVASQISESAQL